jgi:hypothetical protein
MCADGAGLIEMVNGERRGKFDIQPTRLARAGTGPALQVGHAMGTEDSSVAGEQPQKSANDKTGDHAPETAWEGLPDTGSRARPGPSARGA